MENFADNVVANEWGYGKWSGNGPELKDLPLEWSLVGSRSRGVISYGQLDAKSPPRLHRIFALEALLGGVTPWPPGPETFELYSVLKPIGDLKNCRFTDWRNDVVKLHGTRCASAVYSLPGEAYVLLANLEETAQEVRCILSPQKFFYPIAAPEAAVLLTDPNSRLDVAALLKAGVPIRIPADSAVLMKVR